MVVPHGGFCGARVFTVLMDAVHAVNMGAMLRLFLKFGCFE